jgi:hypothetical protein
MLAPLPDEPVFTDERRTVKDEVPRLLLLVALFLRVLFSTLLAVLVGGGAGVGGGTGSGILGALGVHIFSLLFGKQRFVLHYMLMF